MAFGMTINVEKYNMYFYNTNKMVQRNLVRILGFQIGTLLVKYLGILLCGFHAMKRSKRRFIEGWRIGNLEHWTLLRTLCFSRLFYRFVLFMNFPYYQLQKEYTRISSLGSTNSYGVGYNKPKNGLFSLGRSGVY